VSSYDGLTSTNVKDVSVISKKNLLKSTTCIPNAKFSNIKNVIKQGKEKIWKNWDIENFPLFLTVFNIPKKSWNIQKHKFVKLIIESFDSRNSSFIAGFSG
jgi:hypothetical protein